MRVITGSARGLLLSAPKTGARPTMDRVREAIFSSLGDCVPGARVLDLFAGSGALGIEALSRGAAAATFVDSSRDAARCIQSNLAKTKLAGTVRCGDAFRFLESCGECLFDLIFADPPYAKYPGDRDFAGDLLRDAATARALAPGGTLVLEFSPGQTLAQLTSLSPLGSRRYGSSHIAYYTKPSPGLGGAE